MKKYILIFISILLVTFGTWFVLNRKSQEQFKTIGNMKITSSAFEYNQYIPKKYTCDGENVNPPLTFSEVPSEAKSLVLIVSDPDAPSGDWTHWIVFNISPDIKNVDEYSTPKGTVARNSFSKNEYGGPCPPSGTHRYIFALYALDTILSLDRNVDKKTVLKSINSHVLSQTEITGVYSRQ